MEMLERPRAFFAPNQTTRAASSLFHWRLPSFLQRSKNLQNPNMPSTTSKLYYLVGEHKRGGDDRGKPLVVWRNGKLWVIKHKGLPDQKVEKMDLLRFFPPYQSHMLRAPDIPAPDTHLKRPDFLRYSKQDFLILRELSVGECILKNPHPNLAEYRGVLVQLGGAVNFRGFWLSLDSLTMPAIVALCFKKYSYDLDQMNREGHCIDGKKVLGCVAAALEHLHKLGIVHCDLKPGNIFADGHSSYVLGDFDACHNIGDRPRGKMGAPGWHPENWKHAKPHQDWFAYERLMEWLTSHGYLA